MGTRITGEQVSSRNVCDSSPTDCVLRVLVNTIMSLPSRMLLDLSPLPAQPIGLQGKRAS